MAQMDGIVAGRADEIDYWSRSAFYQVRSLAGGVDATSGRRKPWQQTLLNKVRLPRTSKVFTANTNFNLYFIYNLRHLRLCSYEP